MYKYVTLTPEKSAFVDSYRYDKSLAGPITIFIGNYKKAIIYRALMKFNLDQITSDLSLISLQGNIFIEKAILKLYYSRNDYVESSCTFDVHNITSSWNLDSISFVNQPTYDQKACAHSDSQFKLYEYAEFDITDLVKNWWLKPDTNYGIIIKAQNEREIESLVGININPDINNDVEIQLCLNIDPPEEVLTNKSTLENSPPSVAILTPQFYQVDEDRCLFGGGERYLIDLAKLLQKLGYIVDVYQASSIGSWLRTYDGVNIYGLSEGGVFQDFFIQLNTSFYEHTKQYRYHIYFNIDMLYPHIFSNSICICHGIWWDSRDRYWWRTESWYNMLFTSLDKLPVLVSVDTNTINWINAVRPELKCTKFYIPNYVDVEMFKPQAISSTHNNLIRILYPRRLCPARGFDICKALAIELTQEIDNIRFSFVGRGTEYTEEYMKILCSQNPKIEYAWYDMNEMFKAYDNSDIVLIPSLYSEGTSLSLLEAMACGKPVIAGLVGGLTDLILQGFNGYLIEINKINLKKNILELINNRALRVQMGQNATKVVQSFSKQIWEQRWTEVINMYF